MKTLIFPTFLLVLFVHQKTIAQQQKDPDSLKNAFSTSFFRSNLKSYTEIRNNHTTLIFSIRCKFSKEGALEKLSFSANTPPEIKEETSTKSAQLNLDYFKNLIFLNPEKKAQTFIVPVMYLPLDDDAKTLRMNHELTNKLPFLFEYEDGKSALKDITLVQPIYIQVTSSKNSG